MEHLSDHGLLALVGRGDREAFARLYDHVRRRGVLARAADRPRPGPRGGRRAECVPGRVDAGDAVRFVARGQPSTWILTMTHHKAVDIVRREERRRAEPLDDVAAAAADPAPPVERAGLAAASPASRSRAALRAASRPTPRGASSWRTSRATPSPSSRSAWPCRIGTVKSRTFAAMDALRDALAAVGMRPGGRVEHVDELIAGHALRALSSEDEERVVVHLAECEQCRRKLRETEAVAASLAYAVPQVAPPPELRERVLAISEPVVAARRGRRIQRPAAARARTLGLVAAVRGGRRPGHGARPRGPAGVERLAPKRRELEPRQPGERGGGAR